MKQFMEQLNNSLLEAARIDGDVQLRHYNISRQLYYAPCKQQRYCDKTKQHLLARKIGNVLVFLLLAILGAFMALPIVYSIVQAFKPMEEIFIFPPRFTVQNPTGKNFKLIGQLAGSLWVPFSRYLFNSIFVSFTGTFGNVLISSMAAYPLAKHDFPGKKMLFRLLTGLPYLLTALPAAI